MALEVQQTCSIDKLFHKAAMPVYVLGMLCLVYRLIVGRWVFTVFEGNTCGLPCVA